METDCERMMLNAIQDDCHSLKVDVRHREDVVSDSKKMESSLNRSFGFYYSGAHSAEDQAAQQS